MQKIMKKFSMLPVEMIKLELESKGFCKINDALSPEITEAIKTEIKHNIDVNYNDANLANNSVYISDKSEGRESHAMMVSQEISDLPSVSIQGDTLLECLKLHDGLLSALTGSEVNKTSRSMMNFQLYYGESKPVAEHYDGHYMDYDKISSTEFKLKEGLLPRYVMVFNIENNNIGEKNGTHFRNVDTNEDFSPTAETGSFIIFDNLKVRHWVPKLTKPRVMLGFRNFDHMPVYFTNNLVGKETEKYQELKDKTNPGFIAKMESKAACLMLKNYYDNRWPKHWEEIKKSGAVF